MRPAPDLAVLIATRDGARHLAATLESLIGEADDRVEVILVDASRDEATLAIARRYRNRLRLTIVARPSLRCWTAQTNLAASFASARWLTMLGQDDIWLPGRMTAIRRWIAADPHAVLHRAPSRVIDRHGHALGRVSDAGIAGPVVRADAFAAAGGLDEELGHAADADLWFALARAGAVAMHAEALTGSRTITLSGAARRERRRQRRIVRKRQAGARSEPAAIAAMLGFFRRIIGPNITKTKAWQAGTSV